MKVKKIDLSRLRNDEHFQFQTEFRDLIVQDNANDLKILTQFESYQWLFTQEDEALHKIIKSAITKDIEIADRSRDDIFRGTADANLSAGNHFLSEVRTAARKLQTVFDTYGNLAAKAQNEETSAITNLVQELKGKYVEEAKTVGITGWVTALESANTAFEALIKGRYDEDTFKTGLVLKQVRAQVDAAYRTITERIDALMLLEGGEVYENFIRRLNVVIEKYNSILARRK